MLVKYRKTQCPIRSPFYKCVQLRNYRITLFKQWQLKTMRFLFLKHKFFCIGIRLNFLILVTNILVYCEQSVSGQCEYSSDICLLLFRGIVMQICKVLCSFMSVLLYSAGAIYDVQLWFAIRRKMKRLSKYTFIYFRIIT
jgi:hypothetical protein